MDKLKQFFLCDSIYESFKLLHTFSKLFGFTSYKFDFRKKKEAYFDVSSSIQFSAIIFVWICIACKSFQTFTLSEQLVNSQNFVTIIFVAHAAISPFFYMITIFYHNLKRKNVTNYLKTIYVFDENVKNFQWKFQFQNHNFSIIFVATVTVLLLGFQSFYVFKYTIEAGIVNIELIGLFLIAPIHIITMSNLLLSSFDVLERFKILNRNFTWWQICRREISVNTLEKEKLMLKNLTKLYGKLINAIGEINSVYTVQVIEKEKLLFFYFDERLQFQIIPFFISTIVTIVTHIYTEIKGLSKLTELNSYEELITLLVIIIHIVPVVFLFHVGSRIYEEVSCETGSDKFLEHFFSFIQSKNLGQLLLNFSNEHSDLEILSKVT